MRRSVQGPRRKDLIYFLITQWAGNFTVQIMQGARVPFCIPGANAIACDNQRPIALISIDRRCSYTGMGVDSCQNQRVRPKFIEQRVKPGSKEGAISFFHDDRIGRRYRELLRDLTTPRAFDRDEYTFQLHFEEGIVQVRLELLADPSDGASMGAHQRDKIAR